MLAKFREITARKKNDSSGVCAEVCEIGKQLPYVYRFSIAMYCNRNRLVDLNTCDAKSDKSIQEFYVRNIKQIESN